VKLSVDGKIFSEPLTVAHDPRVTIPAAAYDEEFDLARKIEAQQVKLAEATHAAHALHAALDKARTDTSGGLLQSIDALDAEVVAAANIVNVPNPYNAWTFPPDNTQNFLYLGAAFDKLMRAVDGGADAAPSPDSQTGFTRLSGLLDASLQKWHGIETTQLPSLNAQLQAAGKPPITLK
jgi:hypothetical protein